MIIEETIEMTEDEYKLLFVAMKTDKKFAIKNIERFPSKATRITLELEW